MPYSGQISNLYGSKRYWKKVTEEFIDEFAQFVKISFDSVPFMSEIY
jgi:hypothetical protein